MVGGLAAAQIIVVHAGQVIVDQGVVVYQLQRTAVGQRQMPIDAAQAGKLQRQHRPDALAAGQQAVPDGLVQFLVGGLGGEQTGQIVFDALLIRRVLCLVAHGHSSARKSLSSGAPSGPFISLTTFCSALSSSLRH